MPTARPFPEAIAVERGRDPLPPEHDLPSARLRRRLLHGETVPREAGLELGASDALMYAVVKNMKEWGFEFRKVPGPDGGFQLANTMHIPTVRVKPTPKKKKAPPKPATEGNASDDKLSELPESFVLRDPNSKRGQLVRRLLDGETVDTGQITKELGLDAGVLRRAVKDLEDVGYIIERSATKPYKYTVKGTVKAKQAGGLAPVPTTHAAHRAPLHFDEPLQALEPVPQLDQNLQVYLTYRDRVTGEVKVGIRNGTTAWLCKVEAHVDDEVEV